MQVGGNWLKALWMSKLRLFWAKSQWPQNSRGGRSFSDTELAKNHIQQILGRGLADNLTDGIHRDPQVHGREFQSGAGAHRVDRPNRCLPRAIERVLMT